MAHNEQLHFYDAANSHNVPSGVPAAVYINARFAWAKSEIRRMSKIFSISVEPEAFWAKDARCIDIENGAAGIENAVPFVIERRKRHNDATNYVNRNNWEPVIERFQHAMLALPFFWVATLDGTMEVETKVNGVTVRAWAVQYFGGPDTAFDKSILHGVDNLHKPPRF